MANKLKGGLVTEFKAREKEKAKQAAIKKKHNISGDVIVVEKNNFAKFTVNTLICVIKCTATIILLFLAVVGLFSCLEPTIRAKLIDCAGEMLSRLQTMINL